MAFKHKGFWHPMDTVRDRDHLEALATADNPPWMEFENQPADAAASQATCANA